MWLFCLSGKLKRENNSQGREMDELITALTRRGRGAGLPLHHPALTAAGQPRCHNQAERLRLRQLDAFQPLRSHILVNTRSRWRSGKYLSNYPGSLQQGCQTCESEKERIEPCTVSSLQQAYCTVFSERKRKITSHLMSSTGWGWVFFFFLRTLVRGHPDRQHRECSYMSGNMSHFVLT